MLLSLHKEELDLGDPLGPASIIWGLLFQVFGNAVGLQALVKIPLCCNEWNVLMNAIVCETFIDVSFIFLFLFQAVNVSN